MQFSVQKEDKDLIWSLVDSPKKQISVKHHSSS